MRLSPYSFLISLCLAVAATAQPVNVALQQPTQADSLYTPAYPSENAVDGNPVDDASRWLSANTAYPHWLEIDLGQSYLLSGMLFKTGKNGQGPFPLYDFALQYWDGSGWTDLYSETGSTNTGTVDASFGPSLSGNRIRLYVTAGEDNIVRLFEIEVMGEPHALSYASVYPSEGSRHVDHTSDVVVSFDAPVAAGDLAGIRIENLDTSTDLAGLSASVSGNNLVIGHGGLPADTRLAVHVPAGAALLAADGSTPNGSLYWEFETGPLEPELTGYTDEIPNLSDPVELVFDREIALLNPGGIRIERFEDGTSPGGTGVSVAVDTVTITHDPLVAEQAYLVVIEAGALEGVLNGQPNPEMRRLVYAGSSILFSTTFESGLDGFMTGHLLGAIAGTNSNYYWRRYTDRPGPTYDSTFLGSRTNYYDDFFVSPQVAFKAGRGYTLEFKATLARSLHVGTTPSQDLDDVDEIALVTSGSNKSVRLDYTAGTTGIGYFIFFTGETNNWQNQEVDDIVLTESIPPIVRINAPADGLTFRESDSVPVQIEAYGIAGDVATVEVFDNDVLRANLDKSGLYYPWDWDYHAPGPHTLRVDVTDARGNTTSAFLDATVTFDDDTLPLYLGYDFDSGAQGWTANGDGTPAPLKPDSTGRPGQSIQVSDKGSRMLDFSSPRIFLLAGETYTVSFKCRMTDTGSPQTFSFLATTEPGYPLDGSGAINFQCLEGGWSVVNLNFTVAADGPYHLTFFEPSLAGYYKLAFDDIRLIGNFNSVPFVNLITPPGSVRTFAGADVLLEAEASDSDGSVTEVSFRDDGGALLDPAATVTAPPYSFLWTDVPEGSFQVIARALDDRSAVMDSSPRSVTVEPNNLTMSTYLGGTDTDEILTAAAYLSDGTLILGGRLDPAFFPGVTPLYLNGSAPGDRGVVARLSEDGTTILSVAVVGPAVHDLDVDGSDRIHVAAGSAGALVLNPGADTVLWSASYAPAHAHRIDASATGNFAVLISETADFREAKIVSNSSNPLYDANFNQIGLIPGAAAYTTDIAVDEQSETVIVIGWKNITSMEDGSISGNPVDIPAMIGRAYDGTVKWRAYDWEKESSGSRWLNLYTNNMADTRGNRVIVHEGNVYAGIEFDGGNTPLRYDPFDLSIQVNVVGGDAFHSMYNTSTVPKTFVGVYEAATGAYQTGQWITNRLDSGIDNTIRIKNGNLMVDTAGRIHVVGSCAAGLPMTHDPFPGSYTGGGYHLVYSPDFESREFVTRLSVKGDNMAVALSPNGAIAIAGQTENAVFLKNAFQSSLTNSYDATFHVGQYDAYYDFQGGGHPRLFFDAAELLSIRERLGQEPYASMYAELLARRDSFDFYRPYDPLNAGSLFGRAKGSAMIYALSGDENDAAAARSDLEAGLAIIGEDWASSSVKGLTLYAYATDLAIAYDLCAGSGSWDAAFKFQMSKRLVEISDTIVNDGGTEQPSSLGSNWKAIRGSSAGLALLATDHVFDESLADGAHSTVINYLNLNQGGGSGSGWNPEGFGYTAYPFGGYLGPYAIAAGRNDPARDITGDARLMWMTWTGFAGATTAYDVYGLGGVKTDWSDDNAHVGGEGTYGLAFFFADEELLPGIKHAYDRFMGGLSPNGPRWDNVRHGTFWSILYYPESVPSQDPTEIWSWHRASDDSGGIGLYTFRNTYANEQDILVQFKARLRVLENAHDGPDGLAFKLIGADDAFVVGGGRDSPGKEMNQATVYPQNPDIDFNWNNNSGTLAGTPLFKPDGGGHVIAQMATSNVGTTSHKRWFITDYDMVATGADATIIVADTSTNGLYWQIPTFLNNTVTVSGNTFLITGTSGATLKGTILHPGGTPAITTGTKERGSGYTLLNGGTLATEDPVNNPRIEDNRYLFIEGNGDGDFLVVMTLSKLGNHPNVTHLSGNVADASIRVGNRNYALLADDVLYSDGSDTPLPYAAPDATVTFSADGKGDLGGAAVQSIPYGSGAIAPVVSAHSGYQFMGWNKLFSQVVKSMTVTALYDSLASGFGNWIADPLYGLAAGDQDPGDDFDLDGFPNLFEYALVLNPSLPDGGGVIHARIDGSDLVLGYRVRDGMTDVSVAPRYANSLQGDLWSPVPEENISITGSGSGFTEYEAVMPVVEGGDPVFMALEVNQIP